MPLTLEGDHGRPNAASSHARRTAGGGEEKIQNLLRPADMRNAPSASPRSRAHHIAALTLARSATMGLDHSGSTGVFQDVSRLSTSSRKYAKCRARIGPSSPSRPNA